MNINKIWQSITKIGPFDFESIEIGIAINDLRGPMYGTLEAIRLHVLTKPGSMIPFNAFCSNGEIRYCTKP